MVCPLYLSQDGGCALNLSEEIISICVLNIYFGLGYKNWTAETLISPHSSNQQRIDTKILWKTQVISFTIFIVLLLLTQIMLSICGGLTFVKKYLNKETIISYIS